MTARSSLGIVLLLTGIACGSRSADEAPFPRARTTVTVINHNTLDMHMYAISGSQMNSLGMVQSLSRATWELPAHVVASGDVRILADPIGQRTGFLTDRIVFTSGDEVEVTLENNLALSSYAVR